jgi:hypothetical protein
MKRYDPLKPPDPDAWLALDEGRRIDLVRDYHRRARVKLPNANIHAVIHATVETQVALGEEMPVRRTLARLMHEGLDRHSAVHAVGSVLAQHLFDLMNSEDTPEDPNPAYFAALEDLNAEDWLAEYK